MGIDEPTIVEPNENEIVRASFVASDENAALLVASLASLDVRHRVLALRGLVRQSLMSAQRWTDALHDPTVEMRRDALEQLTHVDIEDVTLLDVVVALLHDDDALVVDAAAFALGEHLYGGGVVALCGVARDHGDARCRESAIAALGAIGDERARATILASLKDKPAVRRRAIVALANFEGPDIDAALDEAQEDRDWQVRSAVTQLRRDD